MKLKRRNFLQTVSLGSLASLLPNSLVAQTSITTNSPEDPFDFECAPYLQYLTDESVSIVVLTTKNALSKVELISENGDKRICYQIEDGLIAANKRLIKIRIDGLIPGTTYTYKVNATEVSYPQPYRMVYLKEIESPSYSFQTSKSTNQQVSCYVYNDIHEREQAYAQLFKLGNIDKPDFVVLNGDMFDYHTGEKQLITKLLKPLGELFSSSIPFILNRGNHETRGNFCREIKQYFAYPTEHFYQAFRQGPVFWILLDAGEDKVDTHRDYANAVAFQELRERQAVWLEKIMQSKAYKSAPFKVVITHIPPFYSGEGYGPMENRRLFAPLFNKYKVDVVLSGHTHTYGYHAPSNKHNYPLFIGGGPKEGNRTLMTVQADTQKLEVKMILDNGQELGTFVKQR